MLRRGNLEAINCPNDLYAIEGVSDDMKASDYHICRDCSLILALRRQSSDITASYYKLFAYLERRDYAEYPPTKNYLEGKAAAAAKHVLYLKRQNILFPGMTIAHVRCDAGALQAEIQSQFPDCTVHGYDYFESNIRYAREQGLDTVDLLDPAGLKFDDGVTFDLIICNHTFTHAIDPASDLKTLHAALKQDGVLYLYNEVNHQIRFQPGHRLYQWVALNNFHKQLLSPPSLAFFLTKGGFTDISLSNDGIYMQALARRANEPPDTNRLREFAQAAAATAPALKRNFLHWAKTRNSRYFFIVKLFSKVKFALCRQ